MNKLLLVLFVFFLTRPCVYAQDSDQSSSGVLVSPSINEQMPDQGSRLIKNGDGEVSSGDVAEHRNDHVKQPSPPDDIIAKSTDALMQQITINMKLTPDQINAIRPIIEDNIAKTRDLQLSLQKGIIDGKAMYSQSQQLAVQENQKLGAILTIDQMRAWLNIQNP